MSDNKTECCEQLADPSRVYREAPVGLCCLDTDLRYVHINEWLAALNGLSVEEHLGRAISEVLPDVAAGVGSQLRRVIETGEPILEGTVEAETQGHAGATRYFQHNYHPIKANDGTAVGVSCMVQDITERKRTEEKLAEANARLEKLAMIDALTGIANRRCFEESLSSEWERAKRHHTPLSLVLVDIDHFKAFNDNYGHLAGDDCLKMVAAALTERVKRSGDLLARYGGEEFAVVVPATDTGGAGVLAENLRAQIEALQIPHAHSSTSQHVTVSAGVASTLPTPDLSPAALIIAADQALYQAKQLGRNRVCKKWIP